jgi:hypothetical protein
MKRQIEDYLRARGVQYFRGHHDDEYFFFVDFLAGAYRGRLNVHIDVGGTESAEVLVTISPDRYYPAEKEQWLGMLADRWNAGNPVVQAVVHGSCDPRLVGVQARSLHRPSDVAALTGFVEAAVGAGIDLFARISSAELPEGGVGLRDAG